MKGTAQAQSNTLFLKFMASFTVSFTPPKKGGV
jgi:hypothetical protein